RRRPLAPPRCFDSRAQSADWLVDRACSVLKMRQACPTTPGRHAFSQITTSAHQEVASRAARDPVDINAGCNLQSSQEVEDCLLIRDAQPLENVDHPVRL